MALLVERGWNKLLAVARATLGAHVRHVVVTIGHVDGTAILVDLLRRVAVVLVFQSQ